MWDFRASSPTKVWSHSISIGKKLFYYVFLLATKKYRDITYNHPIKGWLLWDTTSLSKCTLFSLKCTAISGRTTKAPTADETQETGKSANPAVHAYPVANNGPQATTTDRRNTHALRWSSPAVPTDGTIDQLASQPRANRVARVGACVRTWWDPIAGLGGRATMMQRIDCYGCYLLRRAHAAEPCSLAREAFAVPTCGCPGAALRSGSPIPKASSSWSILRSHLLAGLRTAEFAKKKLMHAVQVITLLGERDRWRERGCTTTIDPPIVPVYW
jgi:hypothetical protein